MSKTKDELSFRLTDAETVRRIKSLADKEDRPYANMAKILINKGYEVVKKMKAVS